MKYRYMAIIAILVIAILGGATYLLTIQPSPGYWEWHFPAGEWVEVTFTQEIFDCIGSNQPEDVLMSVILIAGEIWMFQEQDGSWKNWVSTESGNTLLHILPDVPCSVKCESACTLLILKC